MANLSSVFQDALADHAKTALVDVISRNPKTSVSELAQLVAANPALGTLTLDELVSEGGRKGRKGGRKVGRKPNAGGSVQKRDVRKPSGRDAFDKEVFEALTTAGGDQVAASTLRKALDADPAQLRAALNRMIEQGAVTFVGKARGTRYSIV